MEKNSLIMKNGTDPSFVVVVDMVVYASCLSRQRVIYDELHALPAQPVAESPRCFYLPGFATRLLTSCEIVGHEARGQ